MYFCVLYFCNYLATCYVYFFLCLIKQSYETSQMFVVLVTQSKPRAHLDFAGGEVGGAVYPLQRDGVELPLVQVHHGQL